MEISLPTLIELALDLSNSLTANDRFERLLSNIRNTIRCDAIVLLKKQNDHLKPLAIKGLHHDLLGRRFLIDDHPRFAEICSSKNPIRFPADSTLPDPYDGMLLALDGDLPVHACCGLPLFANNQLIGALTLDSLTPGVFDDIAERSLDLVAAMAAAALNTAILLENLEQQSQKNQEILSDLTSEALNKDGGELIGNSIEMQRLKLDIETVATSDFTVLVTGESGVGKELVARTLHQKSKRRHAPLVYVNCAALAENLIESELFGHVKGAFTGADKNRQGKFSLADGGTIFLDEIGELPLASQSKLLRVLQNSEIQTIGQDKTETIDIRVIAATNRDLAKEVQNGNFRTDLYHRLSVYPINVPPLRNRPEDIILLTGYFAEQTRRKLGLQQLKVDPKAYDVLTKYPWPGNVRELEHIIARTALKANESGFQPIRTLQASAFSQLLGNSPIIESIKPVQNESELNDVDTSSGLKHLTDNYQRQLIITILAKTNGNWAAAARELKVDRANLNRLAKRLGIAVQKTVIHY